MDRVCLKISAKIGNKDITFEEIYCGQLLGGSEWKANEDLQNPFKIHILKKYSYYKHTTFFLFMAVRTLAKSFLHFDIAARLLTLTRYAKPYANDFKLLT